MIRTYQAEHGGLVFYTAPSRRQKMARTRMLALAVIAAIAGSAALLQAFHERAVSRDPSLSRNSASITYLVR